MRARPYTNVVVKVMLVRTFANSYKDSQHITYTVHVPAAFKSAYVRPPLKNPYLDQNTLKNYRPVSNLYIVS